MIWWSNNLFETASPYFRNFVNNYSVDEDFDTMTPYTLFEAAKTPYASYEDLTILDMCESYPGMSSLEIQTLMSMYEDFVDPLVDWWTLSDNEKQQLAEAYWLQYLAGYDSPLQDDTAEVY